MKITEKTQKLIEDNLRRQVYNLKIKTETVLIVSSGLGVGISLEGPVSSEMRKFAKRVLERNTTLIARDIQPILKKQGTKFLIPLFSAHLYALKKLLVKLQTNFQKPIYQWLGTLGNNSTILNS